jgi:CDGSH iron-sulfur domain-containing protein 3
MEPKIAQKTPYVADLEEGKDYYWCSCGQSKKQPFCDGSHAGSEFKPLKFTAKETGKAYLCGCKHTKNAPYCDGSHSKL